MPEAALPRSGDARALAAALLGVLFVCLSLGPSAARAVVVTMGVAPQRSPLVLARVWAPLLRAIGRVAHCRMRFATARSLPTFQRRMSHSDYDLAYLDPYQYYIAHRDAGYQVLVRDTGHLRGILFVNRASRIRTLRGLDDHMLAFPAPDALAASLLPQTVLQARGIRFRAAYLGSQGAVYRSVAVGLYVAGAGVAGLPGFSRAVRARLRILWTGPSLPPHPLVYSPVLPPALVARLRKAFLALSRGGRGRTLLARIDVRRFVPVSPGNYRPERIFPLPLVTPDRAVASASWAR